MLRRASLHHTYVMVFSGDPALHLPVVPDEAPGNEPERKRITAERERLLRVARETGNWPDITVSGEVPTLWTMRSIVGELSYLHGEAKRHRLTVTELAELCFRYSLVDVENLEGLKLLHGVDAAGRKWLHSDSVTAIKELGADSGMPSLGHDLILELGALALNRAENGGGLSGKS